MSIPKHIAIIMDGNGRWASSKGLPRSAGHREGMKSVERIVQKASDLGISALTLYAFSTENWKRPKNEVLFLMELFCEYIKKKLKGLMENNVRIRTSGEIKSLPEKVQALLEEAKEETKENKGLILNIALNYGGRDEIVRACKKIIERALKGEVKLDEIDEGLFSSFLDTDGLPDPDLLIRTSGEMRISNFLLWQIAYTEIWITPVFWPDFGEEHLIAAITDYQKRKRRFGKIK